MKPFTFHNPGKLVFGKGALKKAGDELKALGAKKAFLVTDEFLAGSEMTAKAKTALGEMMAGFFGGVVPDTGIEIIDRAAAAAREAGADAVVSLGGGSSIDTGKAVAAMLTAGAKSVRELIGFYKLTQRPAAHIAIPTTAGTGSECTSMAVVKDREAKKKLLLLDPKLIPSVGILDPVLSLSMPAPVTAATGMDAMTHAAEAVMSTSSMPPADGLALHALGLIARWLPQAVADGSDIEARSMMLIASAEAGQAFQNAYVGIVHAMAHALGGLFGVPHGTANGLLLWLGMDYNREAAPERVAMIGKAMGLAPTGKAPEDAARAVAAMREFAAGVGIPMKLGEVGVKADMLGEAAELALADAAMFSNPRKPEDAAAIEELYRKVI